ncbi:MAG: HPF/RaiA family ribosome-associated protein, partial [Mycolicibacterium sp.]
MRNQLEGIEALDIDVTTHGEFPGAADYVRDKFDGLGRYAHRPIRRVHVKLLRRHDPAVAHPVIAQANLDIDGRPVR